MSLPLWFLQASRQQPTLRSPLQPTCPCSVWPTAGPVRFSIAACTWHRVGLAAELRGGGSWEPVLWLVEIFALLIFWYFGVCGLVVWWGGARSYVLQDQDRLPSVWVVQEVFHDWELVCESFLNVSLKWITFKIRESNPFFIPCFFSDDSIFFCQK